jgi:hypothetical protein
MHNEGRRRASEAPTAGAYRVRILSSVASTPLTISGAWYR